MAERWRLKSDHGEECEIDHRFGGWTTAITIGLFRDRFRLPHWLFEKEWERVPDPCNKEEGAQVVGAILANDRSPAVFLKNKGPVPEEVAMAAAANVCTGECETMPAPECCGECRFFSGPGLDACRRYPPNREARFSRTLYECWCGEFERRGAM